MKFPCVPCIPWFKNMASVNLLKTRWLAAVLACAAAAILASASSAVAEPSGSRVVRDIPYAPALGAEGCGDLHLPASGRFMETSLPLASGRDAPTARPQTPPVLLLIHGGGWSAGKRDWMASVAEFFRDDLGFAVFNIDYRLASETNRWPACGDDCLAAANWLFSDEFSRIAGFSPSKIWLCGGSAGGHLALWTLVNLPPEKIAGCVSISSIGDPAPDFFLHRGRYTALFGKEVSYSSLDAMNPLLRVRPGMAPLLCTHAGGDGVVPVASHRAFAEAYAAAGNRCDFFEYPCDAEPNTGGHCIWRKGRKRLLGIIEERIARFVREVEAGTPHSAEDTLRAPELLFAAPFDGTARASFSKGRPEPIPGTRNLRFVAGRRGQAVERKRGIDSLLGYPLRGNLDPERGTVMFWFKPDAEAQSAGNHLESRKFLCTKVPTPRRGSGALMFWQWGWRLRADQSDDGDRYAISSRLPKADQWHHLAFTWGPEGHDIYLDGRRATQLRDSGSPLRAALSAKAMTFSNRVDFAEFFVGGSEAGEFMDGAMDDLEIWSAPLPPEAIAKRFHDDGGVERGPDIPDYGALFNQEGPNRFEGAPLAQGGLPGKMKLLSSLTLDSIPDDPDRFISSALCSVGSLGGTRYLQAGDKANDRFAVRFEVPPQGAPCVIEIDYPDDALRTMDIIVQGAGTQTWERAEGSDNMLQEGVACGDEYPNTGRILTHRCIYWPRTTDVALIAMTARAGAPAAISEIRVYAIEGGALPAAAIHEPPANDDGWHRTFALYYEDPAIHFDFDVGGTRADTFGAFADRAAALMRYTGQNLLCYPGAWYGGVIGEDYMPRVHAPGYRTAWYEKFDREGLGFMPTINQNNIRVPLGAVTREAMENGSLNQSPISIWDDGRPNPGGWHGTPPNFNIAHPDIQREIERAVDLFIEEGRDHPSFKGVALHLTRHCLCWFGDERSGYNEYAIRAFCRERGIAFPASIDGAAPLRGKAYAEWLREDPARWEAWLDWRCDVVARLYRRLAEKLRAARPDLKLVVNSFLVPDFKHPDFGKENFVAEANRRAGLDPRKLADVPNLSICQTEVPADYRFRGPAPGSWKEFAETAAPIERDQWFRRGSYALLDDARFPWVNQHDRYWESRIGGMTAKPGPGSLACPWLKECGWRVTTINPSGRHALKHYAAPFRFHDLQALSKGGYLIGTYGTEEVLVPFIQAFRALPAVVFDDLPGLDPESPVRVRAKAFRGKAYFYAINTGDAPDEVHLAIPAGTTDLVGGEAVEGDRAATVTLKLEPYELRSFSAPEAGLRDLALSGGERIVAAETETPRKRVLREGLRH